jgi:hypothetical protein
MRPLSRPFKLQQTCLLRSFLCRAITTSATLPVQVQNVQLPKLIISPGSAHHNSLPSFLEYADRKNLAPTRSVYIGTHYEYTVALALLRLGFSLLRTGRRDDAGIDLIGHWILPQLPEPIPVIVQCKAWTGSARPEFLRELEGAIQGAPPKWRKQDVLGLLVFTGKATKGVLESLGMNRSPLGFLKVDRDGTIEQFLWNRAATEKGLEGVGVTVRHTPLPSVGPELQAGKKTRRKKILVAGTKKDIQLTWMGNPIFPDREDLDEETLRLMGHMAKEEEVEVVRKTSKKKAVVTTVGVKRKSARAPHEAGEVVKRAVGRPTSKTHTINGELRSRAGILTVRKPKGRPPGSKNKKTLATEAELALKS